ncbi:hypothetical protein EYR38_003701 [Pleurotus pulmonarius]|nr:hypothetical protein EYR38_003701 [Pleurotus pulmonarius]
MASIFADKVDEDKIIDWLESKAGTAAKQAVSEQYYSKFEQTDNAIAEVNSRLSNDAKKIATVVKDMESLTRRMEVIETNLHKTMDDMSGFATTAAVKRIVEREVENILPRGPQSSVQPEPPSHPMDSTNHSRTPASLFDPLPLEPGGTPIPQSPANRQAPSVQTATGSTNPLPGPLEIDPTRLTFPGGTPIPQSSANRQAPSVQTATGSTNPLPVPLEIDPTRLTFPLSLFTYLGYPWKRPDFSTIRPSTTLFDALGTWSCPWPSNNFMTWTHPSLCDTLGTWRSTIPKPEFGTLEFDFFTNWIKIIDHLKPGKLNVRELAGTAQRNHHRKSADKDHKAHMAYIFLPLRGRPAFSRTTSGESESSALQEARKRPRTRSPPELSNKGRCLPLADQIMSCTLLKGRKRTRKPSPESFLPYKRSRRYHDPSDDAVVTYLTPDISSHGTSDHDEVEVDAMLEKPDRGTSEEYDDEAVYPGTPNNFAVQDGMDGSVALDNMNYAPIDELDPIIDEQPQGTMNGNSIYVEDTGNHSLDDTDDHAGDDGTEDAAADTDNYDLNAEDDTEAGNDTEDAADETDNYDLNAGKDAEDTADDTDNYGLNAEDDTEDETDTHAGDAGNDIEDATDETDNYDLNAGKDTGDADTDNHAGDAGDDIEDVRDDVHNHALDIGYDSDDTSRNAAQIDDNARRDGVTGEGCLELEGHNSDNTTIRPADDATRVPGRRPAQPLSSFGHSPKRRVHFTDGIDEGPGEEDATTQAMGSEARALRSGRHGSSSPLLRLGKRDRHPSPPGSSPARPRKRAHFDAEDGAHRRRDGSGIRGTNVRTIHPFGRSLAGRHRPFAYKVRPRQFMAPRRMRTIQTELPMDVEMASPIGDEEQWFGIDRDAEGHGDNGDTLGTDNDNDKASDDDVVKGSQDGTSGDDEQDGQDSSADRNGKYSARDGNTSVEEEEEEEEDKDKDDEDEDEDVDEEDEDEEDEEEDEDEDEEEEDEEEDEDEEEEDEEEDEDDKDKVDDDEVVDDKDEDGEDRSSSDDDGDDGGDSDDNDDKDEGDDSSDEDSDGEDGTSGDMEDEDDEDEDNDNEGGTSRDQEAGENDPQFNNPMFEALYGEFASGPMETPVSRKDFILGLHILDEHFSPQSSPQRSKPSASSIPSSTRRKHHDAENIYMKRNIRSLAHTLLQLKKHSIVDRIPSAKDLKHFSQKRPKSGPTVNNWLLQLDGPSAATPWNKRALDIFVEEFLRRCPGSRTDESIIRKAASRHLGTLRKKYRAEMASHEPTDSETEQVEKETTKIKARKARRRNLLQRRQDAVIAYQDYPNMALFVKLLSTMPYGAMSGDETELDKAHGRVHAVKHPSWRSTSVELNNWLRGLDALHMSTRFNPDGRPRRGAFPHRRIRGRSEESPSNPAHGLPHNFYSSKFLQTLDKYELKQLKMKPEITLSFPPAIQDIINRFRHVQSKHERPLPAKFPKAAPSKQKSG